MRQLFRHRQARRYLFGQSVSLFGDLTLWLAMGIWAKTLTGNNGAAGLTFFFFALPQLAAPLSGALVDRFPRRHVLIVTNLSAAALVLCLLGVRGAGQLWLIYAVMFGYGASYTILSAGGSALLRTLLPEALLPDANGYLRTVQEGLRLIGPITGAALFTLVGGAVLALIDAATFVIAAIALATVRVVEAPAPHTRLLGRAELTAGLRHLWRTPVLRQLTGSLGVAMLLIGTIESVAFAVVGEGLHRSASFLGVLTACQGVGAVIGGPTAAPVIRRLGDGFVVAGGLIAFAGGCALIAFPQLAVVIIGMVLSGFSLPWLVVGNNTALQRHTPLALQGRVSSAADLVQGTPQIVSIAIGAALVSALPYQLILSVTAVTLVGCATYLFTRREQRIRVVPVPACDTPTRATATAPGLG